MKVQEEDGEEDEAVKTPIKLTACKRCVVWFFACGTEIAAWCCLLMTGITFIMTANNVEMVMRSTVSIGENTSPSLPLSSELMLL